MASPINDDKSNIAKIKKKSEEKTPIWKTFLKSVIVFILMILCGAHFISLTRLTDNQLDFMFPDKLRLFPFFIESSDPNTCPPLFNFEIGETVIGALLSNKKSDMINRHSFEGAKTKGLAKKTPKKTPTTTDSVKEGLKKTSNKKGFDHAGGGLYSCPSKPYSESSTKEETLTKKKDYLVFPYSMASDVENPGSKIKVLDDSAFVQSIGGDSFEKYGTTTLRSFFGSNFAKIMCQFNSFLKIIVQNSEHLPDSLVILFQFVILGLVILAWGLSLLFSVIWSGPFGGACGSANNEAYNRDGWGNTDSWPRLKNAIFSVLFPIGLIGNMIFCSGVLIKVLWQLYFQQMFSGNFEEIKRVLHCNLPFISLLFPLIFWSLITDEQKNDVFGETTYITMGICWLVMACSAIFSHYSNK